LPTDEHHDERYEDGDESTGTVEDYSEWTIDIPIGSREPDVETFQPEFDEVDVARTSFFRWTQHGGKRRWPDHPNLETVWPAFWQGWRDSRTKASDFKRRGMAADERDAYMSGRFLSSAHRRNTPHERRLATSQAGLPPEDNQDEVDRAIAEHEQAIFENPDPFYGP